MKQKNNVFVT